MIIIAGTASLRPDQHAAAVAAMHKMAAASQADKGCEDYRFAISVDDPEGVDVFECWTDQAALDAHLATPHTAEFIAALGELSVEGTLRLTRYEVSGSGPFTGASSAA